MSIESDQKIDYLYKEYVRLSEKSDELIMNTMFDDLKLYGVVGAIIMIWKPISELVASSNTNYDSSHILFLGFLSILAINGIISYQNLLKQAYAWYFIHNLQAYEVELKKVLGENKDSQLFNFNLGKEDQKFITSIYKISFKIFAIFLCSFLVFVPFVVLIHSRFLHAGIYLFLSISGSILYVQSFKKMMRQYSQKKFI